MGTQLDTSLKGSITLVRFWTKTPRLFPFEGYDTTSYLYCDEVSPESGPEGLYQATPSLEVEEIKITGLLGEDGIRIDLPKDAFTSWLTDSRPHPRVFFWVYDKSKRITSSTQADSLLMLFRGEVISAIRNYRRRKNSVSILAENWKNNIEIKMGMVLEHNCWWALFGPGCTLDKEDFKVQALIDDVDDKIIVTTDANIINKTGIYWRNGWVEVDGAHIRTRIWNSGDPSRFFMERQVPADWAGGIADFYPGCDKLYTTCDGTYNNKDKFMGLGYSIPYYQPVTQGPRFG